MPAFQNIAATPAAFNLVRGTYGFTVHATFGGGSVALARLAQDGVTYITVQNFTADGYATPSVPDGTYKLVVTTATAVYADVAPISTGDTSR